MKTPFAPFLHLICTVLAAALLLVLSASAGDLAVRVIDRSPDVRNLDTTDTLKWYADESIDYTVRPRRGKETVSIPGDAVATWIIADAATGTNYLSAVAASQTSNSVTFHLPLGGAALPEGVDEWVSFVSLLQGTNFLGVIDRTRAECLWSPYTSAAALVPTNPLPELLRQFATTSYVAAALAPIEHDIQGIAGDLAHQAEDIAAIEEAVAAADSRIDGLWGEMPGGWRYPDYFEVRTIRAGTSEGAVGWETTQTNTERNVRVARGTRTTYKGWEIDAEVVRQSDWDDRIEWEGNGGAAIPLAFTNNLVLFPEALDFDWLDTFDDQAMAGACNRWITGRLGSFETEAQLEWDPRQRESRTWYRFDGPAPGSLLAAGWNAVLVAASNAAPETWPKRNLRTWPDGTSSADLFVRAGWNTGCWAWGLADYSCVSYWTDSDGDHGIYKPLTLVTPRHAIVAQHYKPSVGSNVYWTGRSGAIYTNQVTAYRHIRGDLTVARLASPMPADDVGRATLLAPGWSGYVLGSTNSPADLFGFPAVALDCSEKAWLAQWRPSALARGSRSEDAGFQLGGASIPFSREAAVGGDSGSPVFWPIDGTNTVLLGCYYHPNGGPLPSKSEVDEAIASWGDAERCEEYDLGSGGWTNYDTPPGP